MYGEEFPGKKVGCHSSWELLGSGGRVKLMLSLVSMGGVSRQGGGRSQSQRTLGEVGTVPCKYQLEPVSTGGSTLPCLFCLY